jgi:cell division protein FtsN
MKRFFLQRIEIRNLLQGEAGKIHRGGLLALLLIFAVGGYVYYFTDLVGHGEESVSETSQGSLVKKPMPQRPVAVDTVQEEKSATQIQQDAAFSGQNTGAKPALPVNPSSEQKSFSNPQTATKPSTAVSKPTKTAMADAKTHVQSQVRPSSDKGKPATEEKKQVERQEQPIPEKPPVQVTKSASKPSNGTYTLQIGVYVTINAMGAQKAKLKAAGLSPVVTKGPSKMEPMNRLFIGEYENYAEAAVQMQRLRKAALGAFILPERGKHILYAGSYFVKKSAERECSRLVEAGFKPELRTANLPVSTMRLTAGNFQSRKSAEKEAERLKKLGIKASVVQQGS